jgi:hypothetical protein
VNAADSGDNGAVRTRLIRLVPGDAGLMVTAAGGRDADAAFDPVVLPRLPLTLAHWLSAFGEMFWQERSACLAVALLLDVTTRRWAAVPPTQRCGRRRSRWSLRAADFGQEPVWMRLAGSFATVGSEDLFEAARSVPMFDGLHLIQLQTPRKGEERGLAVFLRFEGEARVANPANVVSDDLRDVLRRYASRLRLP